MQPLSIIIAMGLLGVMSVAGSLMVVIGFRRMFRLAENPSLLMVRVILPANAFLLVLGLLVMTLGIRGIYRLLWVA